MNYKNTLITLPDDVARYVSYCVQGDIRTLEGCLVTLSAYSLLTKKQIDMLLAVQIMGKLGDLKGWHYDMQDYFIGNWS